MKTLRTLVREQPLKWLGLICVTMSLMLTSCAPTYDSTADQMLVDTQKQADDGLIKLENLGNEIGRLKSSSNTQNQKTLVADEAQASYSANIEFYSSLEASVETLDQRITSNPDFSTNKIAISLQALEENVELVRKHHESSNTSTLSPSEARNARKILDQEFKALTVYELQIKNGSKPQP